MINGPNHRKDHQSKGKGREVHLEPLVQFITGKGPSSHDGNHFEGQVGVLDKVIEFSFLLLELFILHALFYFITHGTGAHKIRPGFDGQLPGDHIARNIGRGL